VSAAAAIRFGAMAPPLRQQLAEQGCVLHPDDEPGLQADADALTRLYLRGLLRASEVRAARQRLAKRILSAALDLERT
jgi:hypothetical protein